jgi:hypothetical protein
MEDRFPSLERANQQDAEKGSDKLEEADARGSVVDGIPVESSTAMVRCRKGGPRISGVSVDADGERRPLFEEGVDDCLSRQSRLGGPGTEGAECKRKGRHLREGLEAVAALERW